MARTKTFPPMKKKCTVAPKTEESAAQRLDADVLIKIFTMACEDDRDNEYTRRTSLFSSRCIWRSASQVCSSWRNTALAVPSLWRTISLVESHTLTQSGMEQSLALTRTMFERSRNRPLKISAVTGYTAPEEGEENCSGASFQKIMEVAHEERHRWSHINFISFADTPKHITFDPLYFDGYPLLQEMNLKLPSPKNGDDGVMIVNLSSCRRIRSLHLEGRFELYTDGTQLKHLRHVEIIGIPIPKGQERGRCSVNTARLLARIAPNLKLLHLCMFLIGNDIDLGDKVLAFPRLKKLCLTTVKEDEDLIMVEAGHLFNLLYVPALQQLDVEVAPELDIGALVERSRCQIKTLIASGKRYNVHGDFSLYAGWNDGYGQLDEVVTWWLSSIPTLRTLRLENVDITPSFVRDMTLFDEEEANPGSQNRCPSLKTMSLMRCWFKAEPANAVSNFLDMLESRMPAFPDAKGELETFEAVMCRMRRIQRDRRYMIGMEAHDPNINITDREPEIQTNFGFSF